MNIRADPTEFEETRAHQRLAPKVPVAATVRPFPGTRRAGNDDRSGRPETLDGRSCSYEADLTQPRTGKALPRPRVERLGGVDILVHMLGGSSSSRAAVSLRCQMTTGWQNCHSNLLASGSP